MVLTIRLKKRLQLAVLFVLGSSFSHVFSVTDITYGSAVVISSADFVYNLHSHFYKYYHPGTSGQQQVLAFRDTDANDFWLIVGRHGRPGQFEYGKQIQSGDIVRFIHLPSYNHFLHHHLRLDAFPAPGHGLEVLEVTALSKAEGGNNDGDNWQVTTTDGKPLRTDSIVSIQAATGPEKGRYLAVQTNTFDIHGGVPGLAPDFYNVVGLQAAAYTWMINSIADEILPGEVPGGVSEEEVSPEKTVVSQKGDAQKTLTEKSKPVSEKQRKGFGRRRKKIVRKIDVPTTPEGKIVSKKAGMKKSGVRSVRRMKKAAGKKVEEVIPEKTTEEVTSTIPQEIEVIGG